MVVSSIIRADVPDGFQYFAVHFRFLRHAGALRKRKGKYLIDSSAGNAPNGSPSVLLAASVSPRFVVFTWLPVVNSFTTNNFYLELLKSRRMCTHFRIFRTVHFTRLFFNSLKVWSKVYLSIHISLNCFNIIGRHWLRYQRWTISDCAWYRNFRYQTEDGRARHYVEYWIKLFTDIRHPSLDIHVHAHYFSCSCDVDMDMGKDMGRNIDTGRNIETGLDMEINMDINMLHGQEHQKSI